MAWLEKHPASGTFQLNFRLGVAKFKRSLKTNDKTEAGTRLARVEENTAADRVELNAAQIERLNNLTPAVGERHDVGNMAVIDR